MLRKNSKISERAFALAAATVMTAVSVTLAAAMLSARGQWQLYAAKSSEKIILETASYAEAQDFKHKIKAQVENLEGATVQLAGTLTSEDLFASEPFRRVNLRGGVARIVGGGKAPLMFKKVEQDGIVGATSQQLNESSAGQTPQSIIIPALWSPSTYADERKNPSALPLGKDDPFFEIDCRTSFAALSAYSPSRSSRSSGATKSGFGNVIVTQTRTFPISAFTSFDFNPQTEMTLKSPPIDSSEAIDVGRIYSSGKVKISNILPISASQIIAISGIESVTTATPVNPVPRVSALEYEQEIDRIESEYESKKAEILANLADEIADDGDSPDYDDSSENRVKLKKLEAYAVISKKSHDKAKKINDLKNRLNMESRLGIFASNPGNANPPVGVGSDNKTGDRNAGRKIILNDPSSKGSGAEFSENPDAVDIPVVDLTAKFKEERSKSLRGTLVTEDNGGTRLVRNNAVRDLSSLSSEMARHADCRLALTLSAPDPTTGRRHPVFASGGVKLRADTQKPISSEMKWLGEGESSGAPFYWVRGEGNAQGGMIVFDPSRLSFSPALGESSKTRPFSIYIDASNLINQPPASRWYMFVNASQPTEGISIISPQPLYIAGSFKTQGGSVPSMIVSPDIIACRDLSMEKRLENQVPSTEIEATVVTRSPSSTTLFKKTSWNDTGMEKWYPTSPEFTKIVGSAVVWEESQDLEANRVETLAIAPRQEILNGQLTPALVPTVSEIRISGASPTTKKVGFVAPSNSAPGS